MNDLVRFNQGGLPTTADELVKGLQNISSGIASSSGIPFLRLTKGGYFAYGAEKIEMQEGSHWAINPYSLQHGYACWGDGELLGEQMVPFNQPPPPRNELPNNGPKWSPQVSLVMQCMNGDDKGVNVIYKGTAIGLQNAVKSVIAALLVQLQEDSVNIVPVVELEVDSYEHKKYGETFVPLITIVDWVSMDGVAVTDEPEAAAADPDSAQDDDAADDGGAEPEKAGEQQPARRGAGRRPRRAAVADDSGDSSGDGETASAGSQRRRRRAK